MRVEAIEHHVNKGLPENKILKLDDATIQGKS
jgi:hypothetical protein